MASGVFKCFFLYNGAICRVGRDIEHVEWQTRIATSTRTSIEYGVTLVTEVAATHFPGFESLGHRGWWGVNVKSQHDRRENNSQAAPGQQAHL